MPSCSSNPLKSLRCCCTDFNWPTAPLFVTVVEHFATPPNVLSGLRMARSARTKRGYHQWPSVAWSHFPLEAPSVSALSISCTSHPPGHSHGRQSEVSESFWQERPQCRVLLQTSLTQSCPRNHLASLRSKVKLDASFEPTSKRLFQKLPALKHAICTECRCVHPNMRNAKLMLVCGGAAYTDVNSMCTMSMEMSGVKSFVRTLLVHPVTSANVFASVAHAQTEKQVEAPPSASWPPLDTPHRARSSSPRTPPPEPSSRRSFHKMSGWICPLRRVACRNRVSLKPVSTDLAEATTRTLTRGEFHQLQERVDRRTPSPATSST